MSSSAKSADPLDIVDAKSPANNYLIRLLEDKGTVSFQPLTEERLQLVFEVLDSLTPRLGVFSRIIALIRAELHDAVYSQSLSGSRLWKAKESESINRIPFFSLVRQTQSDRKEDLEAVRSELGRVKVIALQREEELRSLRENLSVVQERNQTLQIAIAALQMEAMENESRNTLLIEETRAEKRELEEEGATQRQHESDLHSRLAASRIQIQEMEQLSTAYSALQRVFQAPLSRKKQNMLSLVGKVPAGRTGPSMYAASYLQATRHMYQQLLQVQNSFMDDFDSFLENGIDVSDREESHEQRDKKTEMFLSRLAEISEELLLLNQQRESIERCEDLSMEVTSAAQKLTAIDAESQKTEDRNMELFLSQALYPEETLLNRYAAMIYTSADNGRIFQELDCVSLCDSCGEKTVLCPHKVGGTQVICLPKNCSHIKLCRPRAHLCTMEAKIAVSMVHPDMMHTTLGTSEIQSAAVGSHGHWDKGSPTVMAASNKVWFLAGDVHKLERDWEKRLQLRRDVPRVISLDMCVSLTQQLIVTVIRQLEGTSQSLHIQETVWEFFRKRYVNEDISSRGLQDYLAAVSRYSSDSQVVFLLSLVLQGDLDPTILSYVLLQAEMVALCPLSDMDQFQLFLHTHYPFLEETEWDSLVLEFTSYSGRSVSPPSVMGFILHLILQHKEPLITECEDVLSTHSKTRAVYLTVDELSGALEQQSPLRNKTQIQSFIQRSAALSGSCLIPLHKAAQITACELQRDKKGSVCSHHKGAENIPTGNKVSKETEYGKDISDLQILHQILQVLKSSRQ